MLRRTGLRSAQIAHIFPVSPNPFGLALSLDGHLLAVADYSGVLFFDVAKAEAGDNGAEVGELETTPGASTIEVLFSSDGRYVFASNEQTVSVVDTQRALAGQPALVGNLPAGIWPRDVTRMGDTIVLSNFGSGTISLLDAATLP